MSKTAAALGLARTSGVTTVMKVILDMDTGIDDAIAIVLALNSPELEVLAITTVAGNAAVPECTRNSLLLLELLGPPRCPLVATGADEPISKRLTTAVEVHGEDGLGGKAGSLPTPRSSAGSVHGAKLLRDLAWMHPDEITLVTTGPLTNVAMLAMWDPDTFTSFRRVIVMGGAFDVPGNTGPVAEFNVYVDPEAANIVLRFAPSLTLLPLDVTTTSPLKRETLDQYLDPSRKPKKRPGRNLAAILHRALDQYMRFQESESGLDGGFMHDPLAVAAAIAPGIIETTEAHVDVEPHGRQRGRTTRYAPSEGPSVEVATAVDGVVFQELLRDRVLKPVFKG